MKLIQKDNVFKKAKWFKVHEQEIWTALCILVGVGIVLTALFLWG